jgi:acetyl esterase/lipase
MKRTALAIALMCVTWPVHAGEKPKVVELRPGKAPEEPGTIRPEKEPKENVKAQVEITEPTRFITNVTKPTLTVYRPAKDKDTGAAVIICPGGGYWNLFWQIEGEEVAEWLNTLGVTGIVLKYRVPRRPDEPKGVPARRPLQDSQRAVSLVRSKAKNGFQRNLSTSASHLQPLHPGATSWFGGGLHLSVVALSRF